MTITLSQDTYDAMLDYLNKLRERNVEFEEKLDKEIKLSYEIEKNLYETSKERDELIKSNASVIKYNAELEKKANAFDEIVKGLASISKEIVEYPGDNDKQKEVIYKRYDDLFELMKLLEVNHER